MDKNLVYIGVDNIHENPNNPRQELGDLSELVESIKKNGLMQNLTVVAMDEPEQYMLLIGHRRFAASKEAGLKELPCMIMTDKTDNEQMAIMLEENMQRADLTISEQAQGFQMMLDLGETEDSIAEKTGFSKTTVKRRLEIAKLDKNTLDARVKDEDFQLSITDLFALQKVSSIEKRNEILENARDSRDLVWKAESAARNEKRDAVKDKLIQLLNDFGVEEAPEKISQELYNSNKWRTVKDFSLDEDIDEISFDEDYENGTTWYYYISYANIKVLAKVKKEKKEKTPEDIEKDRIQAQIKELRSIFQNMYQREIEFVQLVADGKIADIKKKDVLKEKLWNILENHGGYYIGKKYAIAMWLNYENSYDVKDEEKEIYSEKYDKLPMHKRMLMCALKAINDCNPIGYDGTYKTEDLEFINSMLEILDAYGFLITEEEQQIIDGTHSKFIVKDRLSDENDVVKKNDEEIDSDEEKISIEEISEDYFDGMPEPELPEEE